jgi:hypothetical protein
MVIHLSQRAPNPRRQVPHRGVQAVLKNLTTNRGLPLKLALVGR